MNPKPGTDTALAMGMVQVIVADGLFDEAYIREQTDLPFLVRIDNGQFLRETDRRSAARAPATISSMSGTRRAGKPCAAPATGGPPPPPGRARAGHSVRAA